MVNMLGIIINLYYEYYLALVICSDLERLTSRKLVVIPVSLQYQRLTTYGFDAPGKPIYSHTEDLRRLTTYDLCITNYGLRVRPFGSTHT